MMPEGGEQLFEEIQSFAIRREQLASSISSNPSHFRKKIAIDYSFLEDNRSESIIEKLDVGDSLIYSIDAISGLDRPLVGAYLSLKLLAGEKELIGRRSRSTILNFDQIDSEPFYEARPGYSEELEAGLEFEAEPPEALEKELAMGFAWEAESGLPRPGRVANQRSLSLVVELRHLRQIFPERGAIDPQLRRDAALGWSTLRLVEAGFVASGVWSLPLFDGKFTSTGQRRPIRGIRLTLRLARISVALEEPLEALESVKGPGETPDYLDYPSGDSGSDEEASERRDFDRRQQLLKAEEAHRDRLRQALDARRLWVKEYLRVEEARVRGQLMSELAAQKQAELERRRKLAVGAIEKLEVELADKTAARFARDRFGRDNIDKIERLGQVRRGLRINFSSLRNIATYDYIKIVVGIFKGTTPLVDEFGQKMVYCSDRLSDHVPDADLQLKVPPKTKIRFNDVSFEFVRDFDALALVNEVCDIETGQSQKCPPRNSQIYLGIQVMLLKPRTKKTTAAATDAGEGGADEAQVAHELDQLMEEHNELRMIRDAKTHGWLFAPVFRGGTLAEGKFAERLKKPEVRRPPIDDYTGLKQRSSTLSFEIEGFSYNELSLGGLFEARLARRRRPAQLVRVRPAEFSVNPALFIPLKKPVLTAKPFLKNTGVDLYVDSARMLADNAGPSKIAVCLTDKEFHPLFGTVQAGLCDLASDALNPKFGFRHEVRHPSLDPELLMVVFVLGLDPLEVRARPRLIGVSVMPLFEPLSGGPEVCLRDGCYQLPLFCQPLPARYSTEAMAELDRLPCASLLVRVREAPRAKNSPKTLGIDSAPPEQWEAFGIWDRDVPYSSGLYNNELLDVRASEQELMLARAARPPLSVRQLGRQMFNSGVLSLPTGSVPPDSDPSIPDPAFDDLLLDALDAAMTPSPVELLRNLEFLSLKGFAKYVPELGFKINVEALIEPGSGFFFCVYSFLNLFDSGDNFLRAVTKINWTRSTTKITLFDEGFVPFSNSPFSRNAALLVKVIKIKVDLINPESFEDVGWTLLPIFSPDGFVNSGVFFLPIIKGTLSEGHLDELGKGADPRTLFPRLSALKKSPFISDSSLCVKLLDRQRDNHFQQILDIDRAVWDHLSDSLRKLINVTKSRLQTLLNKTNLTETIPYERPSSEFNTTLTRAVTHHFDLSS